MPSTKLLGGDLDDNDAIDIGDATFLGANFGGSNAQADINADNAVNIQDLAILGGNYNVSGCQNW